MGFLDISEVSREEIAGARKYLRTPQKYSKGSSTLSGSVFLLKWLHSFLMWVFVDGFAHSLCVSTKLAGVSKEEIGHSGIFENPSEVFQGGSQHSEIMFSGSVVSFSLFVIRIRWFRSVLVWFLCPG